jgi:hypothetical protein
MVISARVIIICSGLGGAQAEPRGQDNSGSLNLFPGIGEGVNSVWGRGVVGNNKCAQVDGCT